MITIYGIPNCDTMKKARNWFAEREIAYQFVNYKTEGIQADTLKAWLEQVPLEKLFNKSSATWKSLTDTEKASIQEVDNAIQIMVERPSIIKRPVVVGVDGKVLAVGFKEADYQLIFA